jgi:alanine racemase
MNPPEQIRHYRYSIVPSSPSPELQIDLNALVDNWRSLQAQVSAADCAAVVKANAYGLGDQPVVGALQKAGCRTFYVTTFEEALSAEPHLSDGSRVFVFSGVQPATVDECRMRGFIPVLSTLAQVDTWIAANRREQRRLPCVIQVDTGMNRLGLEAPEWQHLLEEYRAEETGVSMVMSHLACAEDSCHPLNASQLERFQQLLQAARAWAPGVKASLANSGGILLGTHYHFDQVRPGIALYGGNPENRAQNRFRPVVRLRLPVIQLRRVEEAGFVGYGAMPVRAGALLATVQGGYADGLLVAQSGAGEGEIGGMRVPMLGRISMDLTIFDVSAVPPSVWEGDKPQFIEVLNNNLTIDSMAHAANTISYEILTRLGSRFQRRYLEPGIHDGNK